VGGVADTMSDEFRARWGTKTTVWVTCTTLGTVFRHHQVDYVDVFSLDVEWAELAVLQSMGWSVPVDVWLIELDSSDLKKDEVVRKLLAVHMGT
jgi:hypothetical protein